MKLRAFTRASRIGPSPVNTPPTTTTNHPPGPRPSPSPCRTLLYAHGPGVLDKADDNLDRTRDQSSRGGRYLRRRTAEPAPRVCAAWNSLAGPLVRVLVVRLCRPSVYVADAGASVISTSDHGVGHSCSQCARRPRPRLLDRGWITIKLGNSPTGGGFRSESLRRMAIWAAGLHTTVATWVVWKFHSKPMPSTWLKLATPLVTVPTTSAPVLLLHVRNSEPLAPS